MSGTYGPQCTDCILSRVIVCIMVMIVIANFAAAAVYENACPKEPFISLYLGGYLPGALILLPFCFYRCDAYLYLTSFFFFCWLIIGSIAIYSIYEPNYKDPTADSYCSKTLYMFAFWSTNFTYVLLGVIILSGVLVFFYTSAGPSSSKVSSRKDQVQIQVEEVSSLQGQDMSQISSSDTNTDAGI